MQRLTESPPALQRTQRMAAATPRGIMPVQGEYIPVGPWEADWQAPSPEVEPLAATGRLLFAHREHKFGRSYQRFAILEPIEFYRAVRGAVAPGGPEHGPISSVRVVMPRASAAGPTRARRWNGIAPGNLRALTMPAQPGVGTMAAAKADWDSPEPGTGRTEWKMVERRRGRVERQLLPSQGLAAVASESAAGAEWTGLAQGPSDFEWNFRVSFPAGRLKTIAPVPPAAPCPFDEQDELWSAVEESPLHGLIAATQAESFAPVGKPAKPSASLRPIGVTELSPINPSNAAAGPAAEFTAPMASELQPLFLPETRPANLGSLEFAPAAELANSSERRIPSRDSGIATLRLEAPARILALQNLEPAPGVRGRLLKAAWKATTLTPTLPAPAASWDMVHLPKAAMVPFLAPPAIPLAQDSPTGLRWLPVAIVGDFPRSRAAAPGASVALCRSLPVQWQPSATGTVRRARGVETFLPVSRVRLPRRVSKIARGYESAGCLPLRPPQAASPAWKPSVSNRSELCPPAVLPAAFKPSRAKALRTLPPKLFAIPDCRPMAQPLGGRPKILGMDEWGSKPLVCPSGIRPSSRRRRRRTSQPESPGLKARAEKWVADSGISDVIEKASRLPSDLKWIAMVFPLVIGIWTFTRPSEPESAKPAKTVASAPEVRPAPPAEEPETQRAALRSPEVQPAPDVTPEVEKVSAPAAPVVLTPAVQSGPWGAFTARIAGRASVDLIEDFRNGLSNWDGRGEWARTWSYDRAGTIRPGTLAFFIPSAGLRDYVFELKASVERRAIQWVVRASGPENYHFARLNVTPGTPLTALELERWSIVNGRTGKVTRKPLPHSGSNQTVYTIRVEARGDSITTYLQDQVVDTFNDARLPEGGVGLVGAPEDRPRIYGIHVFHQNDFLGKLCSFLAPQPINSQGSD